MPSLKSWFPIPKSSHFSLNNIPFGIISTPSRSTPRPAIAIGEHVLDLQDFTSNNGFSSYRGDEHGASLDLGVFSEPTLNSFAALGRPTHRLVRKYIQDIFLETTPYPQILRDQPGLRASSLIKQSDVTLHLPMKIGDYTDFFVGRHHAFAAGCLFRGPENALNPNYYHLPVGYHGRASSIVVSGKDVIRPNGQILPDPAVKKPILSPCKRLDYELELGAFVCKENQIGVPIPVNEAENNLFGLVMLNDWSARDIQVWEYQPLGPFNAKNFSSSISPWVVLMDALEPFRTKGIENETEILDYLKEKKSEEQGGVFDMTLEVDLLPEGSSTPSTITRSNGKHLLFSFPQMLAHHTVGGCPFKVGDMLGSGTISGPEPGSEGCLLEMTKGGKETKKLSDGTERTWLLDGDTVTFRGFCGTEEEGLVGFGECKGKILPAPKI